MKIIEYRAFIMLIMTGIQLMPKYGKGYRSLNLRRLTLTHNCWRIFGGDYLTEIQESKLLTN